MKTPFPPLAAVLFLVLCVPALAYESTAAQSTDGQLGTDVIVTAAPTYAPLAALKGGERFPGGAQLLIVHAGKAEPLVTGFWATADANMSFDGTRVLFAGKHTAAEPWQIWELTLGDHSLRKLIASESDAIRPFYLPSGRLVYAQHTVHGFQLMIAGSEAAPLLAPIDDNAQQSALPLSYMPGSAVPVDVLSDGRILFESGYPLGSAAMPEMYLVYSDGSGVESYRCDHGRARWGGRQLASGDVVFTHGTSLARFTSPLAHEESIEAPHAEYAGSIAETNADDWLLSARVAAGARYALKLWKPGTATLKTVAAVAGQDLLEPVVVAPRARPKRHPSALHPWSYANMMALDARMSRAGDLKVAPAQVRLETMNDAGEIVVTGTAPVEADGSFLVRVPGDRPIRFALLDQKGAVLRQEHGWFWIRGGEQRYCVGCHTGPERSSDNHVPAVLLRTTMPVDLTGTAPATAGNSGAAGGH